VSGHHSVISFVKKYKCQRMKNNMNLITIAVGAAIVYFAIQYFKPKKEKYAKIIYGKGNSSSYEFLLTLDESFLQAWSLASELNMPTFLYKGGIYNTQGGRVKR
jgi:hypothetical protein